MNYLPPPPPNAQPLPGPPPPGYGPPPIATRPCDYCFGQIPVGASRCQHCSGAMLWCKKCNGYVGVHSRQKFVGLFRGGMKEQFTCMHDGSVLDGPRW